ncbi:LamG domain-containing protein, partial [Planctomycetota bacterium]
LSWRSRQFDLTTKFIELAATYDGKTLSAYLDGKPIGLEEVNEKRVAGKGGFAIGKRPDDYIFFEGLIDEVRLYKRALSAKEIKKRFENPADADEDKDLVRVWDFEKEEKDAKPNSKEPADGDKEPAKG